MSLVLVVVPGPSVGGSNIGVRGEERHEGGKNVREARRQNVE